MEIDLDLYRVFVSVATNGSVSKAAEELCVTQSAVSQRILKLEKIFEKQLFIRGKRGIKLSNFGEKLFEQCSHAVCDLDKVYETICNAQNEDKTIKICASDTITDQLILPVIAKVFPDKKIIIESLLSDKEKILAVENGTFDFAIINDYNLPLSVNLYKKELFCLEYGFYYNDKVLQVSNENVFQQTLLLKNARTKGRIEFNKRYYALAFKFKNIMEFSHDSTIIEATKQGLGIGFCPKQYVANLGMKELKLSNEKLSKKVVLIYQQSNEDITSLIKHLKK